jgi:hypothetical protein
MRLLLVVLPALLAFAASETEFKTDEGVIVLTKDTYQKAVEEIPFLLVEFCKLTFFTN